MADNEPSVVARTAQQYVGARHTVTMETLASVADRIPDLIQVLATRFVPPAGAPFFRYLSIDMDGDLVVEAGVPIDGSIDVAGDVYVGTLPAGRFATATHQGHPDELRDATTRLLEWGDAQGLEFDMRSTPESEQWGCRLETYFTDPRIEPDMHRWVTELAFRLAD